MTATADTSLWALGLLLQSALLAALVLRHTARKLPLFTSLIAFYLVRSALLFGLFGYLNPAAYDVTYTTLSSLDLVLQVGVAWELLAACFARPFRTRLTIFVAVILVSAALAWLLSSALPAGTRTPIDRGVVFTSALMLGIFLAATVRFGRSSASRALQGFAVLSLAGILTQIGRAHAASHRDAHALIRWSWIEPAAYLAVLVFWLLLIAVRAPRDLGN